jgi:hypothetical protein
MNYQYWNDFVNDWVHGNYSTSPSGTLTIGGWQLPNSNMATFLPEPWWGNDGSKCSDPLYSVVVNYNPGNGGVIQTLNHPQFAQIQNKLTSGSTYQDLMRFDLPTHLPDTHKWHQNGRAIKMIEALRQLHKPAQLCPPFSEIRHHLSVELIPWHTPNTSSKQFKNYVNNNAKAIVNNSIAFAAAQSLRIPKDVKTHGKVIMRMSWDDVKKILERACVSYTDQPKTILTDANGNLTIWKFVKFTIGQFPGVSFRCVWGVRNYLPHPSILKNAII